MVPRTAMYVTKHNYMLETPETVTTRRDKIRHLVFFGKRFTAESYLDEMVNQQERLESALSYVVGTILGDGMITRVTKWKLPKLILQAKDVDFVERFKRECDLIAPGSRATKMYPVEIPTGITFVYGFVQRNLGEYLAEQTQNKKKIPDWIFEKPHCFKAFLEAIIDGEGSIQLSGAGTICNTEGWIQDIQNHLANKLGICCVLAKYKQKNPRYKDYWVLRLPARELVKLKLALGIQRKQVRIRKSSETTCCAPLQVGEDIVQTTVRAVETGRNDQSHRVGSPTL